MHTFRSASQEEQSLTRQELHWPLTSPKPGRHEVQRFIDEQVAQLATEQLVHSVVLERKKPTAQLTH